MKKELVVFIFLLILSIGFASAVWWNPFSWFKDEIKLSSPIDPTNPWEMGGEDCRGKDFVCKGPYNITESQYPYCPNHDPSMSGSYNTPTYIGWSCGNYDSISGDTLGTPFPVFIDCDGDGYFNSLVGGDFSSVAASCELEAEELDCDDTRIWLTTPESCNDEENPPPSNPNLCSPPCVPGDVCKPDKTCCTPKKCDRMEFINKCGKLDDGCGGKIDCDNCRNGYDCAPQDDEGNALCLCLYEGIDPCSEGACGFYPEGCDPLKVVNCGSCPTGQKCCFWGNPHCDTPTDRNGACYDCEILECDYSMERGQCALYSGECNQKIVCGICPNGQKCEMVDGEAVCTGECIPTKVCEGRLKESSCSVYDDGCGKEFVCGNCYGQCERRFGFICQCVEGRSSRGKTASCQLVSKEDLIGEANINSLISLTYLPATACSSSPCAYFGDSFSYFLILEENSSADSIIAYKISPSGIHFNLPYTLEINYSLEEYQTVPFLYKINDSVFENSDFNISLLKETSFSAGLNSGIGQIENLRIIIPPGALEENINFKIELINISLIKFSKTTPISPNQGILTSSIIDWINGGKIRLGQIINIIKALFLQS